MIQSPMEYLKNEARLINANCSMMLKHVVYKMHAMAGALQYYDIMIWPQMGLYVDAMAL